jgi:CheY-like chemotaxis protein
MTEKQPQILLIDDDPDMHLAIELMLAGEGVQLTGCRTGAAGLASMRRARPDLVLLDIMLTHPREGLEVACQMRQDPALKDIPVILMSAIGEKLGSDYAKEVCPVALAAEMFLEKPLDAATVRAAVREVLARRSATARSAAPPG